MNKTQLCGSLKVFVGQVFQKSVSQFWGFRLGRRCILLVVATSIREGRHTRCLIVVPGHLLQYGLPDSFFSPVIWPKLEMVEQMYQRALQFQTQLIQRQLVDAGFCGLSASQVTESAASSNFNTRDRRSGRGMCGPSVQESS